MLFTCFFIFLLYLCMRKCCLSNVVIVVCALIPFIRDSINRRDQRKWISLWIFIATLEVFSRPLSVIYFSGIIKIALSVYFIYFDREQYLQHMYNFILQKIASLQPSKEKVDSLVCSHKQHTIKKHIQQRTTHSRFLDTP